MIYALLIILLCTHHTENRAEDPQLDANHTGHPEEKFHLDLNGFIRHEAFMDSRQVDGARENEVLNFPLKKICDPCHQDIRACGQFNMLAILAFLSAKASAPLVGKLKTEGTIEFDFRGVSDLDIGAVRLYTAYLTLDWPEYKHQLLIGMFYNPMYQPYCDPETVSFNTGSPIELFSRDPQIRFTKTFNNTVMALSATTEINDGAEGPEESSNTFVRNAVFPVFNLLIEQHIGPHIIGGDLNIRAIRHRLVTKKDYEANERLFGVIALAYMKLVFEPLKIKAKFIFAENGINYGLTSGFATAKLCPVNDYRTYTNLRCMNFWTDISYKISNKVEPGIFIGRAKNIGAPVPVVFEDGVPLISGLGGLDIDTIFRISPRVNWYISNTLRMGAEIEYTQASYGEFNQFAAVINAKPERNVRFLTAIQYQF